MADQLAHGVLRVQETGSVYVSGQASEASALPAGAVNFKGAAVRTRALVTTADGMIVVRFA